MSGASAADSEGKQRTVLVPSLLTNSFRAVVDAFGTQIIQLTAKGSTETTNGMLIDELRDYGVAWEQTDQQSVTVDYERLPGADGPVNPLTEDARENLLEEIGVRLDPVDSDVDADLAVTQLTIRVSDDQLREVTPAQSSEFDLYFGSDPVEPAARELTKRRNLDRRLYDVLGFNCRNLNLRSVVETEAKFHQQSDGKFYSWGGPTDIRPRSPQRLAIRINDRVLPDEYGTLKPYKVTDDQVIELVEEEFEDRTEQRITSGGDE
jgi:hypothetical protein